MAWEFVSCKKAAVSQIVPSRCHHSLFVTWCSIPCRSPCWCWRLPSPWSRVMALLVTNAFQDFGAGVIRVRRSVRDVPHQSKREMLREGYESRAI